MRKAAYCIWGLFLLVAFAVPTRAANPVTINFDNLPAGTNLTTQYPQVTFSANGFSAGSGGTYGSNIYVRNTYGYGGSNPNSIVSLDGVYNYAARDVFLDFPIPVNDLGFYILNSIRPDTLCYIDVYVNRTYNRTVQIFGNPYGPVFVSQLRPITNITGIHIHHVWNSDIYYDYPVYYDNFTFTPVLDVKITSGRVSGYLNGTTQKALLGADVALQASILPSNLTGGTYSWSATGPNQRVSASSTNSSYTVRWTETGTYQAKVTYIRNGVTVSATVNVNVTVPTLDNFTANQEPSQVSGYGPPCAEEFGLNSQYNLGCFDIGFAGITFSSTVHIPAGPYLSDLNQSGVKYIQRASIFRKQLNGGVIKCRTRRSSESNNASGWLLDADRGTDAYDPTPTAVRRFSEGLSLTITTRDSPGEVLEGSLLLLKGATESQHDAFKVDDYFEMNVVYFTSTNAPLQRTVGTLPWNWGGVVVYDSGVTTPYKFRLKSMFGSTGARTGVPSSQAITYQGRTDDQAFVMDTCPGVPTPTPTPNPIDNSRVFVRQQYKDLLKREPDQNGWNFWRSYITACDFDAACIVAKRVFVARGFFNSTEIQQLNPALANPPGTAGFNPAVYNPAFVRYLFKSYLLREPDPPGMAFYLDWLKRDGDYDAVIRGFLYSPEYRSRFGPP
jgi:hypothetical protein